MKKFIIISLVLASCQNKPVQVETTFIITDSLITVEPAPSDTISFKISNLLQSTENADKKVKEIKAIKQENVSLKKELVETKAELEEAKAILADTTSEPIKKKKKSFIQKVISTIKKDTTQ